MVKAERGQSIVELALLLPILISILIGVIDLGRAFNAYITITNAAREGARYGSLHPADTGGIKARVVNEATESGVDIAMDDVSVAGSGAGNPIRVIVEYDFPLLTGFLASGGTIQLISSAEMIIFGE